MSRSKSLSVRAALSPWTSLHRLPGCRAYAKLPDPTRTRGAGTLNSKSAFVNMAKRLLTVDQSSPVISVVLSFRFQSPYLYILHHFIHMGC